MLRRTVVYLFAAVLGLGMQLGFAPSASAATCYGDYCSGRDPQASGCAADAWTVSSGPVMYDGYNSPSEQVGTLELRWSPSCKTNWTRMIIWKTVQSVRVCSIQDTGYTQCSGSTTSPGSIWSPMIYSPVRHVRGKARGYKFWGSTGWA